MFFLGSLIFIFIIIIPVIEISVFIQAGEKIGLWSIIGLILITAIIGVRLLRHQGLSTISSFQQNINSARLPMNSLFDGLFLLMAGAFLITPGFVTDVLGLILSIPIFRNLIRNIIKKQLKKQKIFDLHTNQNFEQPNHNNKSSIIIDGEYEEIKTNKENDNQKFSD